MAALNESKPSDQLSAGESLGNTIDSNFGKNRLISFSPGGEYPLDTFDARFIDKSPSEKKATVGRLGQFNSMKQGAPVQVAMDMEAKLDAF